MVAMSYNRKGAAPRLLFSSLHGHRLAGLAVALTACFSPGALFAQRPPAAPQAFGALPTLTDAVLSPDGRTLAVFQNDSGQNAVIFYPLEGEGREPHGVLVSKVKARDLIWANNERVLLTTSDYFNGYEMWRRASISEKDGAISFLFSAANRFDANIGAGRLLSILPDDDDHVLVSHWSPGALGGISVYKANLSNGKVEQVAAGTGDTIQWLVNEAGEPVIRIDYDAHNETRSVYHRKSGEQGFSKIQEIHEPRAGNAEIFFWSLADSPTTMLVTAYNGENTIGLYVYDAFSAKIDSTVFHDATHDISSVIYDAHATGILGVRYMKDLPEAHFLMKENQDFQDALQKLFPNSSPVITSWSADKRKAIVEVVYTDRPSEFYLYDETRNGLEFFAASHSAIGRIPYADTEKFDCVAPDGLFVPGYLTIPADVEKRNLPLVVLPHGGPAARDNMAFDWWAHFYAARGYAVYRPNFRGSAGYGLAFEEAGYREWGGRMQDDITEGVRKLISDGIADPARICIVGASYGGYAALAGAMKTPDLYACAVGVNGVYDLLDLVGRVKDKKSFWAVRIGLRAGDRAELEAASPARNAKSIKAPILLLHGEEDAVVPVMQSKSMNGALLRAGGDVRFIEMEGEDHWLSRAETRTRMLEETIKFIDANIGG